MSKLIQKVNWNLNSKSEQFFMYGEASVEANQEMQIPLEKLYQYENQPDMDNPSLDIMITTIISEEIEEYKSKILNEIEKHFNNPYCAATDIGKVMYEKDIEELINRIEI